MTKLTLSENLMLGGFALTIVAGAAELFADVQWEANLFFKAGFCMFFFGLGMMVSSRGEK